MQLNKYLALCGVASRRKANLTIMQGRVAVNHGVVKELGRVVQPGRDEISLNGQRLEHPCWYSYILLNKPGDVLTAAEDSRGRKTVLDLVKINVRVFPVGRLDYDTEGVLLLTNDGDLAYRLTHPRFEIKKVYEAWVEGVVKEGTLRQLKRGIWINEGVFVSGATRILDIKPDKTLIEIQIHEGKKRQIKRMLKAVGHPVIYLRRSCFAGLAVDGLEKGAWRELTSDEVEMLYQSVGLTR